MKLKQLIIGILIGLLGGSGAYTIERLSGMTSQDYATKSEFSTSSVPFCKRSVDHSYGSSSDITAWTWWCNTSTESNGTPWILLGAATNRKNVVCKVNSDINNNPAIRLWTANTTNTAMKIGTSSDGLLVTSGNDYNMIRDSGVIWPGIIYAMSSSTVSSSTVQCVQYKE